MEQLEFYKGKKVLLTGNTGFKGSWLTRILTMAGADVTGYSLFPASDSNLFELLSLEREIHQVYGDIRDLDHLKKVFIETEPEIVFHLAAQPIVRESYEDPVYTYETNVMGTVHVLECIRQTESVKSFVNVTTDKVYENKEWEYGYREHDRLDGYDPYSNSKSCSELVTHSYQRSFFSDGRCAISTCRAGNVIGGGDFSRDRIIPDCIRAARAGKEIVVRNPNSIRPYQHVLEPLAVYLMIGQKQFEDAALAGCYNVGPDDEDCIHTGELTELFCKNWGENVSWRCINENGPHEANFLKLDCSRIKHRFGWKPGFHVEEAVEKTVAWAKAWNDGQNMRAFTDQQIRDFFASQNRARKIK